MEKTGIGYYFDVWRKYVEFNGRARRREYWYFILFDVLARILFLCIDAAIGIEIFSAIYSIAVLLPLLGVVIRRLHDTNHSGWWCLVPIVNFVFCVQDSDLMDNRFGHPPKNTREEFQSQYAFVRQPPMGSAPVNPAPTSRESTIDKFEQIEKLAALRDKGILTEEEFQEQKKRFL